MKTKILRKDWNFVFLFLIIDNCLSLIKNKKQNIEMLLLFNELMISGNDIL